MGKRETYSLGVENVRLAVCESALQQDGDGGYSGNISQT